MQVPRVALEQSDDSPECWTLQGTQVLGLHFPCRDEHSPCQVWSSLHITSWAAAGCLFPTYPSYFSLFCLTDLLQLIFSSINLMKQLISSSNLFVLQVEMDVYTALKKVLAWGSMWEPLWD